MKRLILCFVLLCSAWPVYAAPDYARTLDNYFTQQNQESKPIIDVVVVEQEHAKYFIQLLSMVDAYPPEGKKRFSALTRKDGRLIKEVHFSFMNTQDIQQILNQDLPKESSSVAVILDTDVFTKKMYVFFSIDRLRKMDEAQIAAHLAYEVYGHVYPALFQSGYEEQSQLTRETTARRATVDFLERVMNSPEIEKQGPDSPVTQAFANALTQAKAHLAELAR